MQLRKRVKQSCEAKNYSCSVPPKELPGDTGIEVVTRAAGQTVIVMMNWANQIEYFTLYLPAVALENITISETRIAGIETPAICV